jgi:hypothetical protein
VPFGGSGVGGGNGEGITTEIAEIAEFQDHQWPPVRRRPPAGVRRAKRDLTGSQEALILCYLC